MGIIRLFSLKILTLVIVCLIVCCVLYQFLLAPDRGQAKSELDRIKSGILNDNNLDDDRIDESLATKNHLSESSKNKLLSYTGPRHNTINNEKGEGVEDSEDEDEEDVLNIAMIFTKAEENVVLRQKFVKSLNSMVKHSSSALKLHLIGDQSSLLIARNIVIREGKNWLQSSIQVVPHDADEVAKQTEPLIGDMLKYFIYKPGAYYSDTLFFFSIVLHKIFPLDKIILLDVDIKFTSDILNLHRLFSHFEPGNVIGIAREQQPVYRHVFHLYRKQHSESKVGDPPPDGLTGFNSAVLLLHLQRMRESSVYESFLNISVMASLVTKYKFQGHLGDQDFFTLLSLEKPQLFYILPCGWNRQLCVWWKGHGYQDVFEKYHHCDEPVNILHGNCNTLIPDE